MTLSWQKKSIGVHKSTQYECTGMGPTNYSHTCHSRTLHQLVKSVMMPM